MSIHGVVLRCPWCNKRNNSHDNLDRSQAHAPGDGMLSVCAGCHGVAVFCVDGRNRLGLRKPSKDETHEILRDRELRKLMREAIDSTPAQRVMTRVWR